MDIRDLSLKELKEFMRDNGLQEFRAKQVFDWVYNKAVIGYQGMKNIPGNVLEKMAEKLTFNVPKETGSIRSEIDGTEKYLLELSDGNRIETVALPDNKRLTLCLSSQIGCACGCTFCSTGEIGFIRDLDVSEMTGQFLHAGALKGRKVDNVVFMGMGEPMLNFDAVKKTIEILSDPDGLGISQTRFTVSTVGIVPGIIKYADSGLKSYLAVSVITPDEAQRKKLVPMANKYSLSEIIEAASYFSKKTSKEVTFEYILIEGETDTIDRAKQLIKLLSGVKAMVNLIPYNKAGALNASPSAETAGLKFQAQLKSHGIKAFFRKEKGDDIKAACGQLAAGYVKGQNLKTP